MQPARMPSAECGAQAAYGTLAAIVPGFTELCWASPLPTSHVQFTDRRDVALHFALPLGGPQRHWACAAAVQGQLRALSRKPANEYARRDLENFERRPFACIEHFDFCLSVLPTLDGCPDASLLHLPATTS